MKKTHYSVFILGAGFSKPAGMPLGDELFEVLLDEARRIGKYHDILQKDMDRFLAYKGKVDGRSLTYEQINLEEFVSYLDIEHHLLLKGSDTLSHTGNASQLAIRNLIARVLHDRQTLMSDGAKQLYAAFAKRLEPDDIVVTFNYDTVLEQALEQAGVPYRLVPERTPLPLDSDGDMGGGDEVVLLKMHGSIDWFDMAPFNSSNAVAQRESHYQRRNHAIFNDYKTFWPERIADQYYDNSLLAGIYRVKNLGEYFDHPGRGTETPLLLSPSYSKVFYLNPLKDFWYSFNGLGSFHDRFVVIGFSLAAHDEYIRQPLAQGIVNFQGPYSMIPSDKKERLKLIDFRKDEESLAELKRNYSFVDWCNAECHFEGFDSPSVDMIFGSRCT